MEDVNGRVAMVTGAASGIGLGMTRAFVKAGMRVMMADIESGALNDAASGFAPGEVATTVCDVSDRDAVFASVQAAVDSFGAIHVLANNAGVSTGGYIDEASPSDWAWVAGVNYFGVLHGCQAVIPHLKQQGQGGHIVNTASMAGLLGGVAGWGPYNSTKFAVVGLTEVLRQEGREAGFGASVLCPGAVNTNIYESPRNRPDRFGPQVSPVAFMDDPDELKRGLNPDVVGQLVLEAIRDNRLYIFTDPRFAKVVSKRFDRIASDFAWATDSSALNEAHAPGSTIMRK
ncbi:MAG: SDR family NAD(P)-dependent oxidoreductase [Proteobacteria bacterium]|nr:SDR family NAD(P)-dependent oxidoreductase [Pseudomonadota bacterium]